MFPWLLSVHRYKQYIKTFTLKAYLHWNSVGKASAVPHTVCSSPLCQRHRKRGDPGVFLIFYLFNTYTEVP